jgi:hypothetical protein
MHQAAELDPSFGEAGILPAAFPGGVDENVQCAVIQGEKFILAGMNSLLNVTSNVSDAVVFRVPLA